MSSRVSIIIPFYNCPYVDQAIASALSQTYGNIEIIVVNDGSSAHVSKITPFMDRIRYIEKENGGTATALNHGIQAATGEYIAWLSSDDLFLPEKVARQLAFMQSSGAGASFTNFDVIDKDNQVTHKYFGLRFTDPKEVRRGFLRGNYVNGCTVMLRKDIFHDIGYFHPALRYTQDYEMWLRLLVCNYQLHYLDDSLTHFRMHDNSGTKRFKTEMYQEMAIIEGFYRPLLSQSTF